jgi:hypothetical protein
VSPACNMNYSTMQVNRRCLELEISLQLSIEREAETKTRTEKANLGLSEKLKQLERDFSNLSIVNGQVTLNPQCIGELERKTGMYFIIQAVLPSIWSCFSSIDLLSIEILQRYLLENASFIITHTHIYLQLI